MWAVKGWWADVLTEKGRECIPSTTGGPPNRGGRPTAASAKLPYPTEALLKHHNFCSSPRAPETARGSRSQRVHQASMQLSLPLLFAMLTVPLAAQAQKPSNHLLQPSADEKAAPERSPRRRALDAVVAVEQTPERVVFTQSRLAVSAEKRSTAWNALWSGDAPLTISGAAFSVEIAGQRL